MTFGTDIEDMSSACRKTETGVDGQENITLFYKDGKMASLQASIYAQTDGWESSPETKAISL